ncbi:chalcone isomerase family protein [Alphaproteobacteria bacterium]|nr:chalcone isomerase family protein [Alphaproteobacteria bacterium]MDC0461928.1 chalcone isomerase family protein [Alphaproteobacteria bacterium]
MRIAVVALFFSLLFQNAFSSNLEKLLNPYNLIGTSSLKVFMWEIYDIQLWSVKKPFSKKNSLILIFDYKRDLAKEKIIESSIKEIEKQNVADKNTLIKWTSFLQKCIRPVEAGSKPYIQWNPEGKITFFYGNTITCSIDNKSFSKAFIDIWLGENTSRPRLRQRLLQNDGK